MKKAYSISKQKEVLYLMLIKASIIRNRNIEKIEQEERKFDNVDFSLFYVIEEIKYQKKKFKYNRYLDMIEEFEPYLEAQSAN